MSDPSALLANLAAQVDSGDVEGGKEALAQIKVRFQSQEGQTAKFV